MEIPLLRDIVVIFSLSIGVLLACHRLRIPSVVGFLITGVLCGPQGFGVVNAIDEVKTLAEIGIVVLLFTVGMEFSIKKILDHKRYFLIAGPFQVGMMTLCGFLVGQFLARPFGESLFLGFLISLSSTAIVMRILQERAETNSPHGRLIMGILIFQDVIVVPMMLITPMLSGADSNFDLTVIWLIVKGLLILAFVFVSALRIVPTLLYHVAKTRSRELFILSVLVICLGVAWITASIGLSLALGAFLAGLIVSESEYSQEAIGNVIPFQDIFTSFFFVSIGMLLNVQFLVSHPLLIFTIVIGIFTLKSLIITAIALLLGMPLRSASQAGFALGQVGEFSFVLAMSAFVYGIGTDFLHQLFLSVAIITMGVTPYIISYSPRIADWLLKLPISSELKTGMSPSVSKTTQEKTNHIIIIGFGFSGRNLARSSKEAKVPYVVVDMSPETVREQREKGEPITYGDASRQSVLNHANIKNANAIAVLVNDPLASLRIIEQARRLNPTVYIVARTRYLEEMKALYQLGANDVIPDELGSTVEIFTRVLKRYKIPSEQLDQLVDALRSEGYEMLRPHFAETNVFSDLRDYLEDVGVKTVTLGPRSSFVDRSLEEINLRKKWGLTVLVIKRDNHPLYHIDATTILEAGDCVVLIGTKDRLARAGQLFNP